MAASKKKRVEEEMGEEIEDDVEYDSNEELDTDEEEGAMEGEVQLDFEARVPDDCDFNGMRTLLQQVFLKANVDIAEMTNTLISQNYIGSVIKQPISAEDDDDDDDAEDIDESVLALTSVINLTERQELNCVKQMKSLLLERCQKCGKKDTKDRLAKLLSDPDHHVGYLLSERYINLPPTLAVPMFESLIKEMDKAKEKNMKYNFDYYLMICKTYELKTGHNKRDRFFSNSEEELFQEASCMSFTYSVAAERDGVVEKWSADESMEPFRTVLVIPAEKLPVVIDNIKQELAQT